MDAKAKVKLYGEVQDSGRLVSVVEEYLGDFNSMTKKPMDLVMFMFFVQVPTMLPYPTLPYPTQLSCSTHRVVSAQRSLALLVHWCLHQLLLEILIPTLRIGRLLTVYSPSTPCCCSAARFPRVPRAEDAWWPRAAVWSGW